MAGRLRRLPALVIHGGAWAIPQQNTAATLAGIRAAALSGWDILLRGGSAVDAVEAAVQVMEDDPIFVSSADLYIFLGSLLAITASPCLTVGTDERR